MADLAIASLAGTVLASSLLGSAHCAGMCGGIALVAIGSDRRSRVLRQAGYHAGRLVAYAALGAACGLAGQAIDDAGVLVGVQRVAAVSAGILIAALGVAAIARALGAHVPQARPPRALVALAQRVHVAALRLPAAWRGVPLGLATPLLPCGWLYAFAAISAGSASALVGALVMAAFWAGTVPALVVASNGARIAFARLGRGAPIVAGIAMLATGIHAALWRGGAAEAALSEVRTMQAALDGADCAALAAQAEREANELPPCCRKEP